jgi:hypothetical protein
MAAGREVGIPVHRECVGCEPVGGKVANVMDDIHNCIREALPVNYRISGKGSTTPVRAAIQRY